jgi:hypothetical protein
MYGAFDEATERHGVFKVGEQHMNE